MPNGCIIRVFTHGKGDKTLFSQFKFAAIGDQHLGWDFGLNLPHRFEQMHRQMAQLAQQMLLK